MGPSKILVTAVVSALAQCVALIAVSWVMVVDRDRLISYPLFGLILAVEVVILCETGPLQLYRIHHCRQEISRKIAAKVAEAERKLGDPQTKDEPGEDLYDG